ncbi:MAG: hypothetical protein Q7W13_11320 [Bacteroidia bacterium]|nr:hypothetical protein [Bacteroidia bacterium]
MGHIEFKVLEKSSNIEDLLLYIENGMIDFPSSEEFNVLLQEKKNENQHSAAFCLFMTNKSFSKYYFMRENAQKGSSTIDIGVYLGSNLIFTIEAKLFPTPKGTKTKPRNKHEYVYGHGAGIQRFKDEKHGVDNSNYLLPENGLIGYVKEKDFDYWYSQVNQWVVDATWSESEKLEKIYFDKIGRLKSLHTRISNANVLLHHFWVKVN